MKTTAELAAEQAALWNGPGGEGWLASYGRIERSIADFGKAALAAADPVPGEQVLDVGCGNGGTTAVLARAVGPQGHVLGVDISEVLVGAAQSQNLTNATFVRADAATYPLKAATYDLVFSRFGVMFFGEPVVAFKNFRQALKSTGRLVFVCWKTPPENPWGLVPIRAAAPHLPPLPRPGPEDPGQYSFGVRARVERILKEAGFGTPVFNTLDHQVWLGATVSEVVDGMGRFGPLARAFADATPAQIEKARAAIAEVLAPCQTADGVKLPGSCWLVSVAQH